MLIKSATVKDVNHCDLDYPGLMYVLKISTVLSCLSKGDFKEKAPSCMNSIRHAVSFQSSFLPLNDCLSMKISLPPWLAYGIATGCSVNKNVREFVLSQHKESKVQIFYQMMKPHFTITRCTTDDSSAVERVTNELKSFLQNLLLMNLFDTRLRNIGRIIIILCSANIFQSGNKSRCSKLEDC